jgi:magnesium transporter
MLEIYFKSVRDIEFKKITDYRAGSWVHVDNAKIEDLNKLSELTGVELTDLYDSLDKYEIPRIEKKEDNIIMFARHPSEEEAGLHTSTMALILTKSFIITISPGESKLIDSVISSKIKLATTQKSKLLLFFLLKITQDFTLLIKKVRYFVMKQEKEMKKIDNNAIIMLTKNEEKLNQYLASLVPMRILIEAITSGRYVSLYEKDYDLLQDLQISLKQSEDLCRVNVKSIKSLRDSYQIIFTNNLNKIIKFLTAITIIFTLPLIIPSIYGMNVKLPLASLPHAFAIIMTGSTLLLILAIFIFIKKKWL